MNQALFWVLMLIFNMAAFGCSHSTPSAAEATSVPMAVIASGPMARMTDTKPGGLWFADPQTLENLMNRMFKGTRIPGRESGLPEIDFAHEGVLMVWMGQQSTGGYALEGAADRAQIKHKTVCVPVRRIEPAKGAVVTQVITNPYLMIRLGKGDFDTITIVDPDGSDRLVVPARSSPQ